MRRLFSYLFSLRARPSQRQPRAIARRVRFSVEPLETRLLLNGSALLGDNLLSSLQVDPNGPTAPAVVLPGGLADVTANETLTLLDPTFLPKSERDAAMGLPLLDSNPGAKATLYLDFTGGTVSDWWTKSGGDWSVTFDLTLKHFDVTTPAFDTDGDPTTFSAGEKAQIQQIWARVAEDFAPFNLNVTTHYYGGFANGQALHVAIGGWDDWAGGTGSGISSIGSFSDNAPNAVFVFANDIVYYHDHYPNSSTDGFGRQVDIVAATATTIAHEAGHAFGLHHHTRYDAQGNPLNGGYDPGTLTRAPIMGDNLSASDRTTWYFGTTDQGPHVYQDDMAVIAGAQNGFGYRADDHGTTMATAESLVMTPHTMTLGATGSAKGIIEQTSDFDVFKFTISGLSTVQVRVDPAQYGPNLMPRLELWSADQTLAASATGSPTAQTISAQVGVGTYYVFVESYGDYGDVGQYTVTVDVTPIPVATLGPTGGVTPPPVLASPVATSIGVKLKALPIKVKGLWQVQVFDAVSGRRKFLVTVPKSQSNRPDVIVMDLNGDGTDDLLILYKVGTKKRRLSVDGLTGSPLLS
jgi:hypothetical protein